MHTRFIIAIFILAFSPAQAQDIAFPQSQLSIKTREKTLQFTIEVATTPEQQKRGLMYRTNLPDMHGMLFVFKPAQPVRFWMKNTPIPLDMLFIDDKGIITQIFHNATPRSTDLIPSKDKVRGVLELKGGTATQYHIATGDRVIYAWFP